MRSQLWNDEFEAGRSLSGHSRWHQVWNSSYTANQSDFRDNHEHSIDQNITRTPARLHERLMKRVQTDGSHRGFQNRVKWSLPARTTTQTGNNKYSSFLCSLLWFYAETVKKKKPLRVVEEKLKHLSSAGAAFTVPAANKLFTTEQQLQLMAASCHWRWSFPHRRYI